MKMKWMMRTRMTGWKCILFLASTLIVSCTGWNSELDTAFIDDGLKSQKPLCEFPVKNNCYTQSMDLLMACVQPVGSSPELIDTELETCQNDSGKLITFIDDSLDGFIHYENQKIQFKVYDGQKKCFRFTGNRENFLIDENEFGDIKVQTLENGDTKVSCFFNESFTIPAAAKTKGCRGSQQKASAFVPGHKLQAVEKKVESGEMVFDFFQFSILGAGVVEKEIFKCQL